MILSHDCHLVDWFRITGFSHLLKGQSGFVSVLVTEIIVHAKIRLSSQLISGLAVWDAFDNATLSDKHRTFTLNNNIQIQDVLQCEKSKAVGITPVD